MLKTVKRIFKWAEQYKRRLYTGFVYSFLVSVFTALPIMIGAYILNETILDMRGEQPMHPEHIWLSLVVIAALIILRFLFSYLRAKTQESVGHEVAANERIDLGEILKRVSLGYFEKNKTGDISATMTTELSVLELMCMKMVDNIVGGYITVGATILCLAFFSPFIALISAAGVLLSAVFLRMLNRRSQKTSPVVHKTQEDMAGGTIEFLHGMSVVKSYGKEGGAMDAIRGAFERNCAINLKAEKGYAPINAMHMLALKLASAAIVLVASLLAMEGAMPLPYTLMMMVFSFSLFASVEIINDSAHVMGMVGSTLDNIEQLKNIEYIDDNGKTIVPKSFDIRFDNVSFGYDERKVVKNVSFIIPQNTITAIVGPSGCGKTTLCNLIARFYDVQDGSISIGGKDVREFTCDSLLKNISMVFQNVYLFNDTVRNNIRFGKADASQKEIIEAAKSARCYEFIMELPNGFDTVISEGGTSLSGGEKQRISIARAILKDAPIVILDEATSSIDPENEHHIQSAIGELTKGKTIIIIAHRLATIEHADQILVMDEGEVVQCGTHQKLADKKGIYRRFLHIRQQAEGWSFDTKTTIESIEI